MNTINPTMKVIVSPVVRIKINEFYKAAMRNHPSLSEETVLKKADRMFEGLQPKSKIMKTKEFKSKSNTNCFQYYNIFCIFAA